MKNTWFFQTITFACLLWLWILQQQKMWKNILTFFVLLLVLPRLRIWSRLHVHQWLWTRLLRILHPIESMRNTGKECNKWKIARKSNGKKSRLLFTLFFLLLLFGRWYFLLLLWCLDAAFVICFRFSFSSAGHANYYCCVANAPVLMGFVLTEMKMFFFCPKIELYVEHHNRTV